MANWLPCTAHQVSWTNMQRTWRALVGGRGCMSNTCACQPHVMVDMHMHVAQFVCMHAWSYVNANVGNVITCSDHISDGLIKDGLGQHDAPTCLCVWERVTDRCFQCLLLCDPHFCRWHASCICRSMSAQHCNCRFNQCVSDAPSIVNLNVGNIDQQIQCWQVILNSELSPQFVDQCRHNLACVDSISVSLMQFLCYQSECRQHIDQEICYVTP